MPGFVVQATLHKKLSFREILFELFDFGGFVWRVLRRGWPGVSEVLEEEVLGVLKLFSLVNLTS